MHQNIFFKFKNLLSTRSTINAFIPKSLINFSHRFDIDIAFFRKIKIRKIKNKKWTKG
jgi:hypothetical protein